MRDGVGIPKIRTVTDSGHVFVRVEVSEKYLPPSYDERKKVLNDTAREALVPVLIAFDQGDVSENDITVEFKSIEDMVAGKDRLYAVFSNGELDFH
jgi:hypothetical protein